MSSSAPDSFIKLDLNLAAYLFIESVESCTYTVTATYAHAAYIIHTTLGQNNK